MIMKHFIVIAKLPRKSFWITLLIIAVIIGLAAAAPFAVDAVRRATMTTVVVDAGHGGIDGGVTGITTGVKESDLNLAVAKLVGENLTAAGFRVVYTRKNDNALYSEDAPNKKRDDMQKREAIIEKEKPACVVSVHMNYFPGSSRRGFQVFYDGTSDEGAKFAGIMQDVANTKFNQPNEKVNYEPQKTEQYILQCSPYPTVIAECGFLSSAKDEVLLLTPSYQAKLAQAIAESVILYVNSGAQEVSAQG
jgi:N-acetylmuramoyl-L-alanine amidase